MLDQFDAYDEGTTLRTPGIQWGASTKQFIQVYFRLGSYAILKVPGQTGWAGRGNKAYYPTEYSLVRVSPSEEDGKVDVREVKTITPGRDRKQLNDLKSLCRTKGERGLYVGDTKGSLAKSTRRRAPSV